ncbi:MAG TPA: SpoIIE family protein phosphatase [Actinomycetota bacterium]
MQESREREHDSARTTSERLVKENRRYDPGTGGGGSNNNGASAEARYRALFESAGDAILIVDREGLCIDANPRATELLGYERRELLSMPVLDLVAAEPGWADEEFRHLIDQERWTGELELRREDGSLVPVDVSATRVDIGSGPAIYLAAMRDLSDRKQLIEERAELVSAEAEAQTQAEAARQRVRFVSDVSELLAVSLDYPATLVRLAEVVVREIADLCVIDLVQESGTFERVAVVHASSAKQALAEQLGGYAPRPGSSDPVARVFATGEPQVFSDQSPGSLRAITQDEGHLRIARELGVQSFLSVPLIARGRTLGVISLVSTNPDLRYGESDVRLAEEIARRAAVRIDNARLYDERDHTAKVLQRSLLPPSLPSIPHVELAARYLPVGEGNEVGGDFYDVFDCGDGNWAAAVGDVCGKGPEAAAVMGLARHTLRAVARFERKPSALLRELNRALLEQSVEERFCTVCHLRLRPSRDHLRITLCSAGHPLPLLLRRNGTLSSVGESGQLLGVFPEVSLVDSVVDMDPGDTLLIYTDGATEQRREAVAGEERLRDAFAASLGRDAEATTAGVEEALRAARGSSPQRDDVALLVIRAAESDPRPSES